MKIKIIAICMIFVLLIGTGHVVYGNDTLLKVYLNNVEVVYSDNYGFPYVDGNNRTHVPFRLTLEQFGAKVTWDYANQTAIAEKNGTTVRVPIGEAFFYKNGELIINDTTAIAVKGRVYVPIRAIMEAFGCKVTWISSAGSIFIDYNASEGSLKAIPKSYDLRTLGLVTSVKDQGEIGACWAFASIGAIESVLKKTATYDLSEDHLSLGHGYNLTQDEGGDYHVAMSYFAGWKGPVLESSDPYGDDIYNKNAKVVKHVQEILLLPKKDYASMKLAIMNYGAIESSIFMHYLVLDGTSEFYNKSKSSYYYSGTDAANHDVLIVGWDDNYSRDNFSKKPSKNGAFICKNSYGTSFGDKGYFYISYEDVRIGEKSMVYSKVEDIDNYDRIYQYDQLGWIGTVGYGNSTAYFGNVYTPVGAKEDVRAVGFYATGPSTSYEVYVVADYKTTKSIAQGQLVSRGKFTYAGYYTVEFDKPITVTSKFAVIVKITTPNSTRPVAVEIDKDVPWIGDVVISDGFGLISPDGINWSRTETIVDSNVCLKAFTDKY